MEIDYYHLAREHFESNIVPDNTVTHAGENKNLYAGLVALTFAIENQPSEILRAIQEKK